MHSLHKSGPVALYLAGELCSVKIWDRIFGKPTTHMDDYLAHKRLEFERKRPAYQAHEDARRVKASKE
jgi:hypothetical protein